MSLAWDVDRLEPSVRLARPHGARALEALLPELVDGVNRVRVFLGIEVGRRIHLVVGVLVEPASRYFILF